MTDLLHPLVAPAAIGATAAVATLAPSPLDGLVGVFGRLHPMMLHLPIGMLVALLLLELLGAVRRRPLAREARIPLAWLTALSAALAAGSGYVLALEPGYDTVTVDRHRILGIAFASACLVMACLSCFNRLPRLRWGSMLLALALLIPAGHLGATTTHGDDFIWAPLRKALSRPAMPPVPRTTPAPVDAPTGAAGSDGSAAPLRETSPDASPASSQGGAAAVTAAGSSFEQDVLPIFATYCIECHGESKAKGRLRLNTLAALRKGGADGPVVIPSDTDASELLRRMRVPLDDPDRMPPSDLDQPSEAEIDRIVGWIAKGAWSADEAAGGAGADSAPTAPDATGGGASGAPGDSEGLGASTRGTAPPSTPSASRPPASPPSVPPADPQAVRALLAALVHVQQLGEEDQRLTVDFTGAMALDDAGIAALLEPLRESIAELSLARTAAGPATMAVARRMPWLERLDLRATSMHDDAFAALGGAPHVVELLLGQSAIGDASVGTLASLPQLRRVHAWRSALGESGVRELAALRPDVVVLTGQVTTAAVLEQEPTVTVARAAPPAAPEKPAGAADLRPINDVCPITGSPIDPKIVILHEGRPVGFCCPNCPKEFWSNPLKYAEALERAAGTKKK